MTDNIVLIGFMGVGKGQVGRALASATSKYVIDCDDLIESYANLKVKKIFAKFGEDEFRRLERRTALWLEENVTGTIISTGGGFFNVPNIKRIGTIVYLHSDFDAILEGILNHPNAEKKIKKRPLLKDLGLARELHKTRLPLYRGVADIEVDRTAKSVEDTVNEIIQKGKLK